MAGHPTKDELSRFLLGKVTRATSDAVAEHLEGCSRCRETIDDLEAPTDPLLRDLRQPPPESLELDPACREAVERAAAVLIAGQARAATGAASPPTASVRSGTNLPSREGFLAALRISGIIDSEHLATLEKHPRIVQAADAKALAHGLVECGALTKFQAIEIYQNRPKGLLFGNYVVLDRIGAGGMGQVFKARHRGMDRIVALKVLADSVVDSAEAIKRFQREVRAAAKLIHPNIVTAFDAGRQDGRHFLVMEFVAGNDLSAVVKRDGPLPIDKVISYIAQAARGLAFAHSKGVVHRDIKPGNLLLDAEGVIRILDMGLARFEADPCAGAASEALTQTGAVMGTVDYMAPEQAFDTSKADAKADVYSLGCTLYRLATGKNLFAGDTLVQKILAHREHPIPTLVASCPQTPPQLDALYQRMVAKRPEQRPTMSELVVELAGLTKDASMPSVDGKLGEFLKASQSASRGDAIRSSELPSLTSTQRRSMPQGGSGRPPRPPLLVLVCAAGFLFICLGVWLVVRDKDGNKVAEVQIPPGGNATFVPMNGISSTTTSPIVPVAPTKPAVSTVPVSARTDHALDFDGASSYVEVTLAAEDHAMVTIEGWVRFTSAPNQSANLISVNLGTQRAAVYWQRTMFAADDRRLVTSASLAGEGQTTYAVDPITTDRWHHFAATWNGTRAHLFFNGKEQGQGFLKFSTPADKAPPPQTVLGANGFHKNFLHGRLDEVRISKSIRYQNNFTPKRRLESDDDTLALYHFDEGSGDILHDASSRKNDAKIFGAVWVLGE